MATSAEVKNRVAIVGGSLGGLSAAVAFVRMGWEVHVYERSPSTFEGKGHGLGYVDVGLWEQLRGERMMRRGRRASRNQGAFFYGDLWKFLSAGLPEGALRTGRTVNSLGDDKYNPTIDGIIYDLAIVADGGWSGLRHHVTSTQPNYAGYVVWRGVIDADKAEDFRDFGVFKSGIFDTIAMPLTPDEGRDQIVCGVFIATPESEICRPDVGTSRHGVANQDKASETRKRIPDWFLPFYRRAFAANPRLVKLVETVTTKGKISPHPQFEYGANQVVAGRIALVGDAAHMASPRTAVGAHTAVCDAMGLLDAFQLASGDIDGALKLYSADGIGRAQSLLRRSREVSTQFMPHNGPSAIKSPSLVSWSQSLQDL